MKPLDKTQTVMLVVVILATTCISLLLLILFVMPPSSKQLHGLLLDLEWGDEDTLRHSELRRVITQSIPQDLDHAPKITLDYLHSSKLTLVAQITDYDFVILSPQGTPWHKYSGDQLSQIKAVIRTLAERENSAILGICGGHQLLALSFGGTVDFIDPAFRGKPFEHYPKEALSERGLTKLYIVNDDPLFELLNPGKDSFSVMESHYEEVRTIPSSMENMAASDLSELQLIRLTGKLVYGMAFHPERDYIDSSGRAVTTDGRKLLIMFFKMLIDRKAKEK